MHSSFYVALTLALVALVYAIELPEVKDQPGKPIDPKQVKNATITFYNNGTYIYMLEVPCDAYLSGSGGASAGARSGQRSGQQQQHSSGGEDHHEEDEDDDDDDDEHSSSSNQQMTPQQRQRQQQQRQQQQSGQQRARSTSASSQQHHEHLSPEELQKAHSGTKCECQCRNKEGEELDDIITVSFGGQKQKGSSEQQRGGSRQSQQQRLQQRTQERQRQQQQRGQQAGRGASQKSSNEEEEGPELVYPEQPRPGQKCIFYEDGEWENDNDDLIVAIKPDQKEQSESEDTELETCTFDFKKLQGNSQQKTVTLKCVDNHGEQDKYNVKIVGADLKPLLTPQQKQELQQQKNQQKGQQQGSQQRNRQQQQQQQE